MDPSFAYSFPSIRGVQANREFYVSMCPLRIIPKVFLFNEDELAPEVRAQRSLNKGRLPELARYMINNRNDYVFSALTASIDGEVAFEAMGSDPNAARMGTLHVQMDSRFIINDGQHRRAAIEMAMKDNPDLANESIAVVFFMDRGLKRCQQMFADLNRYAIRPSPSIGVLYDHRDQKAALARLTVLKSDFFRPLVEMERTTLSARSAKLFTLSALYNATAAVVQGLEGAAVDEHAALARSFWEELAAVFVEWQRVHDRKMNASELREGYIHSHGIVLQALGRVGNALLRQRPKTWKQSLKKLAELDWSRSNTALWEGRAMVGGRVSKSQAHVTLTTNAIKTHLGIGLAPEEERMEQNAGLARKKRGGR